MSKNQNLPLIFGALSLTLTAVGILIWAMAFINSPEPTTNQITIDSGGRLPQGDTVIMVEEQPAATDLRFLIPFALTTFGSLASSVTLLAEWRKRQRDQRDDELRRKLLRIDLELKSLQLQKLKKELTPPAD